MDRGSFVEALGNVFERSPWVAEGAWESRLFASMAALHASMCDVVRRVPRTAQLDFLRAHPDLAGNAARAGAMSPSSTVEQASAGLDRLSDEESARFEGLNAAYRAKFGFPFIIAVRRHDRAGILAAFERRLGNTVEEEIATALEEAFDIARIRLEAMVAG